MTTIEQSPHRSFLPALRAYLHEVRLRSRQPGNKSALRQLTEMICLYGSARLGPGFYYLAGLQETDQPLSKALGFMSTDKFRRWVHRVNDPLYHRASQNKGIEKAILTTYGLPTPTLHGLYHPLRGRDVQGAPLDSATALTRLLAQQAPGKRLCFKLLEAWGGEGFSACEVVNSEQVRDLSSGQAVAVDAFAHQLTVAGVDGLVVEDLVNQHPLYSQFNPSSVNTLRIVLREETDGTTRCVLAFLRAGRSGRLVDNASAGGAIFPIDLESGCFKKGQLKYENAPRFSNHPDNQMLVAGTPVPLWTEALELAATTLRFFPGIHFAGVDVAFSVDGPQILELNPWPDYAGFAYVQSPSRSALAPGAGRPVAMGK